MKEAIYYTKLKNNKVKCILCPRNCTISDGKTGFCGVRKNISGTLYALTYAKISSIAIDPIEKKPLYHFYPGSSTLSIGTYGCNLRCLHCQNSSISHHDASENDYGLHDLSPQSLIDTAIEKNCKTIVWTYNEPSIWIEYIIEAGKLAKKNNLNTVLVTAGVINEQPLRKMLKVIDAYRLDIKGFTEEFYKKLTSMSFLSTVLKNALIAKEMNKHIEIITNIIPNWNDDEKQLNGISKWIADNLGNETPWHVTAYYPSFKMTEPPTPVKTLEKAREIGIKNGLSHIFIGNVSGHPAQNTFCPKCKELLINRIGYTLKKKNINNRKCNYCNYELKNYIE